MTSAKEILELKEAKEICTHAFTKVFDVDIPDTEVREQVTQLSNARKTFEALIDETEKHVCQWINLTRDMLQALEPLTVSRTSGLKTQQSLLLIKKVLRDGERLHEEAAKFQSDFKSLTETVNGVNLILQRRRSKIEHEREEARIRITGKKKQHNDQAIVAAVFGALTVVSIGLTPLTFGLSALGLAVTIPIITGTAAGAVHNKKGAKNLLDRVDGFDRTLVGVGVLTVNLYKIAESLGVFTNFWGKICADLNRIANRLKPENLMARTISLAAQGLLSLNQLFQGYPRMKSNSGGNEDILINEDLLAHLWSKLTNVMSEALKSKPLACIR